MFRPELLRSELYHIIPKYLQMKMIENDPINADCFLYAIEYSNDLWGYNKLDSTILFWELYNDRCEYYRLVNKKIKEIQNKK